MLESAPAHGQDGSSPITEAVFLSVLEAEAAPVRSLGGDYAVAEGERRAAGTFENPSLTIEREAFDPSEQVTVKLDWKPPLDGRRGAAIRAADARLLAADAARRYELALLRAEYRALYASWALSQKRVDAVRAVALECEELARRFRERADRGEESGLDASRLELASFELSVAAADRESEFAHARAHAIGAAAFPESPLSRAALESAVPALPELPSPPDEAVGTVDHAHAHLDVETQRRILEAAESEGRAAGRFLSFPTLEGGWTRIDEEGGSLEGSFFALSLELPIFDRNQGGRQETRNRIRIESSRLDLVEARARVEHAAAEAAYRALYERAVRLASIEKTADAVAAASRALYHRGEMTLADLFDTLASALAARLTAFDVYEEALAAHRELEILNGPSLPTIGGTR